MALSSDSRGTATNPVHIVHVVYRLDVGGMENGLVNIINRLPKSRFRHSVVCLTRSSDFANRISDSDVQVFELFKKPGKDFAAYRRFFRLLRRLRPEILHTRNLGTLDLTLLGMFSGTPIRVHGEHGWDASDPQGTSRKYRLMRRLCDIAVGRYVAVSTDIADWLNKVIGIRRDRVTHICNGVDTDRFKPGGAAADIPWASQAGEELVLGSIGRLDPIKNFDLLLDSVAKLAASEDDRCRSVRLVLVGDGPQQSALKTRARELGIEERVWFAGSRNDVPELLRAFDLFVLPSRNEGISNTVLEAMASGLPVIATQVGGNPELVVDGETGALIAPNDAQVIADAISRYALEPAMRQDHGAAARRRVLGRFSLESMVQAYAGLYDELLSSHS